MSLFPKCVFVNGTIIIPTYKPWLLNMIETEEALWDAWSNKDSLWWWSAQGV